MDSWPSIISVFITGPMFEGMEPCPPDEGFRTCAWNTGVVWPLMGGLQLLATLIGDAGLAIILFTIIVRLILLPLTVQQMKSMRSMQRLQPEIKALQKKYGSDREKLSAETMALYRQHGVNPAMGCLPLLLQMPVLFGLYWALSNLGGHSELFQRQWLWLTHGLHQPDVIELGNIRLPFILPILAAVTQWVQQKMMTPPTDDPQQRMQNQIMQFMPLMMLWFGLSFSAGLALYWVSQNLVGIVQQYFFTGWGSLLPARARAVAPPAVQPSGGARGDGASPVTAAGVARTRDDRPEGGRRESRDGRNGREGAGRGGRGASSRAKGEGRRSSGKR